MTIKAELEALKDSKGIIHAETARKWAVAHPKSELYQHIEHDAETGLREYQLLQIRRLITLHIVDETGEPTMVSLTFDRARGGGYRTVSDVVKAPDLAEIMERDALNELKRVRTKYNRVKSLVKVWQAIDSVEAKLQPKTRRAA